MSNLVPTKIKHGFLKKLLIPHLEVGIFQSVPGTRFCVRKQENFRR